MGCCGRFFRFFVALSIGLLVAFHSLKLEEVQKIGKLLNIPPHLINKVSQIESHGISLLSTYYLEVSKISLHSVKFALEEFHQVQSKLQLHLVQNQLKLNDVHALIRPKLNVVHALISPKLNDVHALVMPKLNDLHAHINPKVNEMRIFLNISATKIIPMSSNIIDEIMKNILNLPMLSQWINNGIVYLADKGLPYATQVALGIAAVLCTYIVFNVAPIVCFLVFLMYSILRCVCRILFYPLRCLCCCCRCSKKKTKKIVTFNPRSRLGITFQENIIYEVTGNSQASKAGVKVGWVIEEVNHKKQTQSRKDITAAITKSHAKGKETTILFNTSNAEKNKKKLNKIKKQPTKKPQKPVKTKVKTTKETKVKTTKESAKATATEKSKEQPKKQQKKEKQIKKKSNGLSCKSIFMTILVIVIAALVMLGITKYNEFNNISTNIANLGGEINQLEVTITNKDKKINNLENELANHVHIKDGQAKEIGGLKDSMEKIEKKYKKENKKLVSDKALTLEKMMRQMDVLKEEKKIEVEKSKTRRMVQEMEHKSALDKKNIEREDLENKIALLQSEISQHINEKKQESQDNKKIRYEMADLKNEVQERKAEIEEMKNEIVQLKLKDNNNAANEKSQTKTILDLKQRLKQQESSVLQKEVEVEGMKNKVTQLKNIIDDGEAATLQHKSKLEQQKNMIIDFEVEIEEKKGEIQKHLERIQKLEALATKVEG